MSDDLTADAGGNSEPAPFPPDWLPDRAGGPASELDLVVLLVNSYDRLDDPPDRLHDLTWLRSALRAAGHPTLAAELSDRDVPALRSLRDQLRCVFEAPDAAAAATILNPLLTSGGAVAVLVADSDGAARLAVAPERTGTSALQARLPAALAAHVAERGVRRLGTCDAGPCSCAYVDRTRGGTRRYCCSYCNDRAAARSYRARKRASSPT